MTYTQCIEIVDRRDDGSEIDGSPTTGDLGSPRGFPYEGTLRRRWVPLKVRLSIVEDDVVAKGERARARARVHLSFTFVSSFSLRALYPVVGFSFSSLSPSLVFRPSSSYTLDTGATSPPLPAFSPFYFLFSSYPVAPVDRILSLTRSHERGCEKWSVGTDRLSFFLFRYGMTTTTVISGGDRRLVVS